MSATQVIRINMGARKQTREILSDTVVLIRAILISFRQVLEANLDELVSYAKAGFQSGGAVFPYLDGRDQLFAYRMRTLTDILTAAEVVGRRRTRKAAQAAGAELTVKFAETFPGDVAPRRAVAWLKNLRVVTPEAWSAIANRRQRDAFFIAGIEEETTLRMIRDAIAGSLERGDSLLTFERTVRSQLEGLAITGGHLRTVYHMNVGNALRTGRYEELGQPEIRATLGYFLFDAIVDSVVRPNHRVLDNGIAPVDWPGWDRYRDPLGYNCRCQRIAITSDRAQRMIDAGEGFDLTAGVPAGAGPDPGFVRI